ncbi:hypothetical protein [Cognaticolwellia beringensis]|uniref:Uncharacterized protein n=1 Tax=Cognaticolwellia beringensis TaxID=1967665 RepID=A0A222GD68_9GAMM|nr:hypothetical protein [Cognaticolwellia beringensis]ASP49603.1 hypothetical protein B5D82_18570 [Cognaticolwellia beringensis]
MFKLFFILTILLTTVSANKIEVVTLSDLSFNQANTVELDTTEDVDSDNPALLTLTANYLRSYTYISIRYRNPDIIEPYFQNFHSRAPPFIC